MRVSNSHRLLRRLVLLISVALLALASISIAFASDVGQPNPITKEASKLHGLYLVVMLVGAVIFALVEALIIWCIVRYRKRSDELPTQVHSNTPLEVIWTGIPIVIVLSVFTYSMVVLQQVNHGSPKNAMVVDVTGFQWQWQFTYHKNQLGQASPPNANGTITITGTAATEPTLVLPEGMPVTFKLHSNDVIHAFFVRNFLYKLDVIPGQTNSFTVTPTQTGSYEGQCAEFCGLDHALMRFHVQIMSQSDFQKWVNSQPATSS